MTRLVIFLLAVLALASGLSWLADRPGRIVVNWQGYVFDTEVYVAVIAIALLIAVSIALWSFLSAVWRA
ncbi:MAG: hypothetical protein RLZ98_3385, partial [Pseudomonadota bacterium]